ncbi:MAG TPA: hypothetical protein HA367_08130 [Candidatus Methanofastidiosum sp.]|nr:hypothetical protein [Methanofastidiosum sp.]
MKRKYTIILSFDEEEGLYFSKVLELPILESKSSSIEKLLSKTEESIIEYVKTNYEDYYPNEFHGIIFLEI